jgi:Fe2+ transport system protein B
MMDKNQLQMDKNITETDLIDHIDESPLEHIIETLPVPAENVNVSNEDAERKSIEHKLANVFMAIKNEKEETKELAQLLKKYVEQQGSLSSEEMKKVKDQFSDILKMAGLSIPIIMPFSFVIIPLIIKLGQKVGVNILPTSFYGDSGLD